MNSLSSLKPSVSAFSSISPSLEMAGRKWSSLLHAGSHYRSLEVHVIANALQMDGILVWAPQNPLTITLTTHWGPSLSFLKRKRKNMAQKKCVTALVQRLLEKRQRSGTWLFVLADVIFFWQASAPPHLHVFPYLFLSRGCCSTWAEPARSQVTKRLTAE